MKRFLIFGAILLAVMLLAYCSQTHENGDKETDKEPEITTTKYKFPSYCPEFPPPADAITFELSQDYPDSYDKNEEQPWMNIDFKTDYKAYMAAVLDYCMEGNIDVGFKAQNNQVRKWYHAPWLHHYDNSPDSGREYLRGLTKEINIPPFTLHKNQKTKYQTWAIAFYNPQGGHTIGKVWEKPFKPDMRKSTFPDGTVTFKLLFTEASTEEVPYLDGSMKWLVNMYPLPDSKTREDKDVRLLQLDIAIKDKRATETGWIFGTFVYDASQTGKEWIDRMVPVGLMWGDDPDVASKMNEKGAFINKDLKQSVINKYLVQEEGKDYPSDQAYITHLGLGGRMNGPVDNPISSCISCHGRAAINLETGASAAMANFGAAYNYNEEDLKEYFHTIECDVKDITQAQRDKDGKIIGEESFTTSDYSYQISIGVHNFMYFHHEDETKTLLQADKINKAEVHDVILRDGTTAKRTGL